MPLKDPEKRRAYNAKWREKHRAHLREYLRKWHEEHPDYRRTWWEACPAERRLEYEKARMPRTTKQREWHWRNNYGITHSDYEARLAKQGGKCALHEVCGSTEPGGHGKHWHVDHDHKTGKIRGLLCRTCNVSRVGTNDLESLPAVIRYLGGPSSAEREYPDW